MSRFEVEDYVTDLVKGIMEMWLKNSLNQSESEKKKKNPYDNVKSKVFTNRVDEVAKPIKRPITAKPVTRPQTAKPKVVIGFGSSIKSSSEIKNQKPKPVKKTVYIKKNILVTKRASEENNQKAEHEEEHEISKLDTTSFVIKDIKL